MLDWWEDNGPPVHVAVAGYLGLIKKSAGSGGSAPKSSGPGDLNELLKMAGPGGMIQ